MKKITLLLIIICVNALNGMEKEQSPFQHLPPELKQEIINTIFATSNTLNEAIQTLEKLSAIHGIKYNTLSDFNALMDVLAKKIPDLTRKQIALNFKLPIAQQYLMVNNKIMKTIDELRFPDPRSQKEEIFSIKNKIIEQLENIDPNFSQISPSLISPLLTEPIRKPILVRETILGKIFQMYKKEIGFNKYYFNEDLIPIIVALLNKGAKPDAQLIEKVEERVKSEPTDLNNELLNLLKQAAGLDLMKRVPRDK